MYLCMKNVNTHEACLDCENKSCVWHMVVVLGQCKYVKIVVTKPSGQCETNLYFQIACIICPWTWISSTEISKTSEAPVWLSQDADKDWNVGGTYPFPLPFLPLEDSRAVLPSHVSPARASPSVKWQQPGRELGHGRSIFSPAEEPLPVPKQPCDRGGMGCTYPTAQPELLSPMGTGDSDPF